MIRKCPISGAGTNDNPAAGVSEIPDDLMSAGKVV